jgi:MYXO-CTERM domain-containing protein
MKRQLQVIVCLLPVWLAVSSSAQIINASGNAGNYSSWPQTANNGSGFGSWTFNNTSSAPGYSGQFLGSSYTGSGGGINSGSGNAFGFYANTTAGAEAQAILPFTGGSLANAQTFSVQMQNDFIGDQGGQEGFDLQNSSGVDLFQFYFNGGASDYYINVGGTQVDTGVGYTADPLTLSYAQGTGDAWSFSISVNGSPAATLSSTSTGDLLSDNAISQVDLFSLNGADSGSQNDNMFFNNLVIQTVPEPSSAVLGGLAGLVAIFAVRRRR